MAFDIPPSSPPMELEQVIEQASVANQTKSKIPELRYQAIKESGMEYGSRTGLVRRGYEITQQLNARSSQLDKAYPLPKLMLDDNVVPPVLEESKDNLNKDSNTALRLSDATYKITENAHFVTTPPTWRDYLLVGLTYSVEVPNPTLMPKTPEEKQVWEDAKASNTVSVHFLGISESVFDKLEWRGEKCSWDTFKSGNYVLVDYGDKYAEHPVSYYQTGDIFQMDYKNGNQKDYIEESDGAVPSLWGVLFRDL